MRLQCIHDSTIFEQLSIQGIIRSTQAILSHDPNILPTLHPAESWSNESQVVKRPDNELKHWSFLQLWHLSSQKSLIWEVYSLSCVLVVRSDVCLLLPCWIWNFKIVNTLYSKSWEKNTFGLKRNWWESIATGKKLSYDYFINPYEKSAITKTSLWSKPDIPNLKMK